MKVALCLTGHFRTFDYVFPYLKKNILDVYNPDVFGFVWSDSLGYYLHPHDTNDPRFKYGYDPNSPAISQSYLTNVINKLNPKVLQLVNQNAMTPYFDELTEKYKDYHSKWEYARPRSGLQTVYTKSACIKLKQEYEKLQGFQYDLVIITRWDILHSEPILNIPLDKIILPNIYNYNGVCDIWAAGNNDMINRYSLMLENIDQLKKLPNFTTAVHHWLQDHLNYCNIPHIEMSIPISICRRI